MKTLFTRLFYGLVFAIPLMLVTFALASASQGEPNLPSQELDCSTCHQAFYETWQQGAHGNASSDPAFRQSWEGQGKPVECLQCHVTGYDAETGTWKADGVTCEACHFPVTADHPKEPMSSDRSAQMCGNCHPETYFEWQVSAHREEGLDCYGCHDPHATSLKTDNPSLLCASCHRDRASNFTHTAHSQQGLTCVDCHLVTLDSTASEGHSRRDHSFFVSLSTCNNCHVYQMHDPETVHMDNPTPLPPDALAAVQTASVTDEPEPVNPLGFTTLSGLIGIALGVIIAPWIEQMQRRRRVDDNED